MSGIPRFGRRGVALLLVGVLVLGTVPGVVAAETRTGGSVVVGEDETVSDLTAFGGTIIVRGTVEGDLTGFGGNVMVERGAEVTGDVEATAGNVRVAGSVGGDVTATGGNVLVAESATIEGDFEAAAGGIVVAGTVGGDARLAGGSITLASTATIDGNVEYGVDDREDFSNEGATIGGTLTRNDDISVGGGFDVPDVSGPIFGIYGFLVNLLVGALLLLVFPDTSERVAEAVEDAPIRTGAIGLGTLIGVPIALVVVAITIVGIPITLAGFVAYALAIWIGTIYGRYAVGSTLLSYTEVENRWADLLAGLVVVAVLVRIPFVGWLFELLVLLLGLGAMAVLLYRFVRGQRGGETVEPAEEGAPA
jgi:cytoskeletal protein CcmA (bactofilin family)